MPHYSTYLTLKPQAYLHYSDIFSSARCLLAHQKTNQPTKKLLLLPSQLLDASGLYPQSSNCFVSSALHLCDIILLIFLLEQEKVSKAQAAQNKAYQEALRSQQRHEEVIGFKKLPQAARSTPQGK